ICMGGLSSGGSIKCSAATHSPILLTIVLLILDGLMRKVPLKKLADGMLNGAQSGISAIFIFFLIVLFFFYIILSLKATFNE
ncbi:hypothetical protein BLX88_25635, partial [Bacillus obstructivus]